MSNKKTHISSIVRVFVFHLRVVSFHFVMFYGLRMLSLENMSRLRFYQHIDTMSIS